jgi:hypothetical protein
VSRGRVRSLRHILLRLFDVMRFRAGPQDLPAGWSMAILAALAYCVQGLIADRLLDGPAAAPRSLLALAVQVTASWALVSLRRFPNRLPQTITALAGTGFLFSLISAVLLLQAAPGGIAPGLALIWFGVFLWSLLVDAHIYRHALSITMSLGVLVAVVVFALNFFVIEALFPAGSSGG